VPAMHRILESTSRHMCTIIHTVSLLFFPIQSFIANTPQKAYEVVSICIICTLKINYTIHITILYFNEVSRKKYFK
jgi:hypothetical protein